MKTILLISIFILVFLLLVFSWVHLSDSWWKRLPAIVSIDNDVSLESLVYKSNNGDILVCLSKNNTWGDIYVVRERSNEVGLPTSSSDILFLPSGLAGHIYISPTPPRLVYMKTGKLDLDPRLVINSTQIEFTQIDGKRVRVLW